jgi:DNA repair protein RecO (recombination protein O)
MPRTSVKGLVIRGSSFGETSKIITLFTLEIGKVKCVAKGTKKSASRKGGSLGLFCLIQGEIYFKEHAELGTIGAFDLLEDYSGLAADPVKYGYGSAFCEILDRSLQTDQPQIELFTIAEEFFRLALLTDQIQIKPLFWAVFLKTLRILGYQPELYGCAICGKANSGKAAFYSPSLGGIICSNDVPEGEQLAKLSSGALSTLVDFAEKPLDEIAAGQYQTAILKEIERFIFAFAGYHMGLHPNLKSFKFLLQLN